MAANHETVDGNLSEAAAYDFTTDPQTLVAEAGMNYTADSIRRYREQVGDVAFRAEPDRETNLQIRDTAVGYVTGKIDQAQLCEALNALYN